MIGQVDLIPFHSLFCRNRTHVTQLKLSSAEGSGKVEPGGEPGEKNKTKWPFMCGKCGMGFRHRSSMKVHELTHTGKHREIDLNASH